jgi:hypothetical protein
MVPTLSKEDFAYFGRKTINEVRAEVGQPPVNGGDQVYVDWLRRIAGLPLRPGLKLVPTLEGSDDAGG